MKKSIWLFTFGLLLVAACGPGKVKSSDLQDQQADRNRGQLSLFQMIIQKPGVSAVNGNPAIVKAANAVSRQRVLGNIEPLYVLNDYIVGNSFRSVNQLVTGFNVKKIEILSGSDASFYGARAASGVIKITTYDHID